MRGSLGSGFSERLCGGFEGLAVPATAWKTNFCCQHGAQLGLLLVGRLSDCFVHPLAALHDLLRVVRTAWLHSLFSAATKLWDISALVFSRQQAPVLHQFCTVLCVLCSLAQCLQAEWLNKVPAQVKV